MSEQKPPPHTAVGTLVRARREEKGLSAAELGRRVGSGRSTIDRIENPRGPVPRPDKLARTLLVLGLGEADVVDALPDDQWGRSVLSWMQRQRQVAERGAARAGDGVALVAVAPTGGTLLIKANGDVDLDRVAGALQGIGMIVTRPV